MYVIVCMINVHDDARPLKLSIHKNIHFMVIPETNQSTQCTSGHYVGPPTNAQGGNDVHNSVCAWFSLLQFINISSFRPCYICVVGYKPIK